MVNQTPDPRLEELTKRAERAKEIAAQVATLKSSISESTTQLKWNDWNTNRDILPNELLVSAVRLGVNTMIKDRMAELENLLGDKVVLIDEPTPRKVSR